MLSSKRQKLNHSFLSETIMKAQSSGEFDWPNMTPDAIGDYLETLGHSVNSSGEHIMMGLLAVIPGLIGPGGKLQVRNNYSEPSSLFSICLADPGAGKSPAHNIIASELNKAKLGNLVIDRYTQNGLFDHMLENNGVAIMFNAEMGMFLENVLKRQSEGTGERQLLCKLYDSTAWSKVSGNQDRIEVPIPVPVIGGYSQPDTFISTFLSLMERNDGFPDRFLMQTPKPVSLHEEEIDEWEEVLMDTYKHVNLSEVFQFIYKYHTHGDATRVYIMSEDAKKMYRQFSNNISDKLNEQWQNRSHYASRISKDKRTALRLALNLHVLFYALGNVIAEKSITKVPTEIPAATMGMAIQMTKHFARQREIFENCCNAVNASAGKESVKEDQNELARRIIFQHPGPFVNPRLFVRNTLSHAMRPTQDNLERAFSQLEEEGFGKYYQNGKNKAFLKFPPECLPEGLLDENDLKSYEFRFLAKDSKLSTQQELVFLQAHPNKDILIETYHFDLID